MTTVLSKIFSKTGDDGFTSLANGKRVKKSSQVIDLCGDLDELSSFLGFGAESLCGNNKFDDLLKNVYRIQRELFELNLQLTSDNKFSHNPHKITELENEINVMSEKLPLSKAFILPGGGESASRFHVARTVCRRAERNAFKLAESNRDAQVVAIYLNRLGDWIYCVARLIAFIGNVEELTWEQKLK